MNSRRWVTWLIVGVMAIVHAYTCVMLVEARHEVRRLSTECPEGDASDWCVGADRDGLGDWMEVIR